MKVKHEPVVTVWRNRIPYPTYLVYGGWRFTWCRDHSPRPRRCPYPPRNRSSRMVIRR